MVTTEDLYESILFWNIQMCIDSGMAPGNSQSTALCAREPEVSTMREKNTVFDREPKAWIVFTFIINCP